MLRGRAVRGRGEDGAGEDGVDEGGLAFSEAVLKRDAGPVDAKSRQAVRAEGLKVFSDARGEGGSRRWNGGGDGGARGDGGSEETAMAARRRR